MKRITTLALVLLAAGCITENNYPTKLGATFCKKYKECEPEQFDEEYDSVGDCKSEAKEQFGDDDSDYRDCLHDAGCKFDSSAAGTCRKSIADSSCDDDLGTAFADECAEVYDCDDADPEEVASCFVSQ